MNRRHDAAAYLDIVARVRRARPDIAFSSDFIVGFPGETDADFEATLALVREVGFASAFAFKYSPRPGTPAAEADGQVPSRGQRGAAGAPAALLESQRQAFNRATRRAALRRHLRQARPPSPANSSAARPICRRCTPRPTPARIGRMAEVEIVDVGPNSLCGPAR